MERRGWGRPPAEAKAQLRRSRDRIRHRRGRCKRRRAFAFESQSESVLFHPRRAKIQELPKIGRGPTPNNDRRPSDLRSPSACGLSATESPRDQRHVVDHVSRTGICSDPFFPGACPAGASLHPSPTMWPRACDDASSPNLAESQWTLQRRPPRSSEVHDDIGLETASPAGDPVHRP